MTMIDGINHGAYRAYAVDRCRCDECRAWKSAKARAYRDANAEKVNAASARRRASRTPEELAAFAIYQREWARKAYANGRPRTQATRDRRRERDAMRRDEIRQFEAEYRTKNADKRRAWEAARRARIQSADIRTITERDWHRLCTRYDHRCAYCGCDGTLTQDHIIPLIRGGRHSIGNLIPACGSCNSSKNDRLIIEWRAKRSV